jgi:hypothetical protein
MVVNDIEGPVKPPPNQRSPRADDGGGIFRQDRRPTKQRLFVRGNPNPTSHLYYLPTYCRTCQNAMIAVSTATTKAMPRLPMMSGSFELGLDLPGVSALRSQSYELRRQGATHSAAFQRSKRLDRLEWLRAAEVFRNEHERVVLKIVPARDQSVNGANGLHPPNVVTIPAGNSQPELSPEPERPGFTRGARCATTSRRPPWRVCERRDRRRRSFATRSHLFALGTRREFFDSLGPIRVLTLTTA